MEGEDRLWAIFWGCVAAVLVSLIWGVTVYNVRATSLFAEHGYIEASVAGLGGPVWNKPDRPCPAR